MSTQTTKSYCEFLCVPSIIKIFLVYFYRDIDSVNVNYHIVSNFDYWIVDKSYDAVSYEIIFNL